MTPSRRQFLVSSTLATLSAAALGQTGRDATAPPNQTPGATPVLGAAPATGLQVTPQDFASAEKLMQVEMSAAERAEAAGNWRTSMAGVVERRVGPRKVALGDADVPATIWNPVSMRVHSASTSASSDAAAGSTAATDASLRFVSQGDVATPPSSDAELAFSRVLDLSRWIRERKLTSERLTQVYLARLKQHDPQLKCVITLCEQHALQQARAADAEIVAGNYRGPLHGIPYGAKDLLDTAGIATTWGAEPFRDRVPKTDAAVIRLLNEAGAVLVAKLSLGALALNDVWFGGQTKNPWVLEEGASGSSAGPASAVAAGLVAFAIGSETQGSIISPSMRCGVTGL